MKWTDITPMFNIWFAFVLIDGFYLIKFGLYIKEHGATIEMVTLMMILLFMWTYSYRQFEIVRDSRIISKNQSKSTQEETQ